MTPPTHVLCLMLLSGHATSDGFLSWLDDAQTALDSSEVEDTSEEHPNSEEELRKDLVVAGVEVDGAYANVNYQSLHSERIGDDSQDIAETSALDLDNQRLNESDEIEGVTNPDKVLRSEGTSKEQDLQQRMDRVLQHIENGGDKMLSTEALDASVAALDREDSEAVEILGMGDPLASFGKMQSDREDSHNELLDAKLRGEGLAHDTASRLDMGNSGKVEEDALEDAGTRMADEELQDQKYQKLAARDPSMTSDLGPLRRRTDENWASLPKSNNEKPQQGYGGVHMKNAVSATMRRDKEQKLMNKTKTLTSATTSNAKADVEALSTQLRDMESLYKSAQIGFTRTQPQKDKQIKKRKTKHDTMQHITPRAQPGSAKRAVPQMSRKNRQVKQAKKRIPFQSSGALATKLKSEQDFAKLGTQTTKSGHPKVSRASVLKTPTIAVKLTPEHSSSEIGAPGRDCEVTEPKETNKGLKAHAQPETMRLRTKTLLHGRVGRQPKLEDPTLVRSTRAAKIEMPRKTASKENQLRYSARVSQRSLTNAKHENSSSEVQKYYLSGQLLTNHTSPSVMIVKRELEVSDEVGNQTSKKRGSTMRTWSQSDRGELAQNENFSEDGELETDVGDAIQQAEDVLRSNSASAEIVP